MENKIKLFYELLRIRTIEETIAEKYSEEKMRCPVHLSIGQEAIPVGICSVLSKKDQIVSAHRSHAHYLAKEGDLNSMIAELYGKSTGCAKGRGGSMHLIDPKVGMVAAVPIVGSSIPIAVGLAWANKLKKSQNIVVVFFGDGAVEEGSFHESLNFTVLHSLNILFVCENNNFSVYTPLEKRQSIKRRIKDIAIANAVKTIVDDGNNVFKVADHAKHAIQTIKKNKAPFFLEFNTFRILEHCGPSNDDNLGYRNHDYIEKWIEKDPLEIAKNKLVKEKILTDYEIESFKRTIQIECKKAFNFAEKSPFPVEKQLYENIYS